MMADELQVNYVDEEIGDVGEEIVAEEVTNARGKKRVFEPGDVRRCSKQSSKKYNTKKRKFYGNQHSGTKKAKKVSPASLKKVRAVRKRSTQKKMEGFRLFHMSIFSNLISPLACPECYECDLYIDEQYNKKKGSASFCQWTVVTVVIPRRVTHLKLFAIAKLRVWSPWKPTIELFMLHVQLGRGMQAWKTMWNVQLTSKDDPKKLWHYF